MEMMREASDATSDEENRLGKRFKTKGKLVDALITINPSKTPSAVYEELKEEALRLIASRTDFYKDIGWMAPWDQIAGIALGTTNVRKALIGFVALADIRGLPSFQISLNRLLLRMKPEDPIDSISDQFMAMKVS